MRWTTLIGGAALFALLCGLADVVHADPPETAGPVEGEAAPASDGETSPRIDPDRNEPFLLQLMPDGSPSLEGPPAEAGPADPAGPESPGVCPAVTGVPAMVGVACWTLRCVAASLPGGGLANLLRIAEQHETAWMPETLPRFLFRAGRIGKLF